MRRIAHTPARLLAAGVIALLLAFGAAASPAIVSADAGNQQDVRQQQTAVPGTASSGDGSAAAAGPAVAYNDAMVHQLNVQVATGDPTALANSTQTATNTAEVNQTAVSASGDATASDGGTATTGYAIAANHAVVLQLNVQVMALLDEDCVATQVASNQAQVDQTSAALSGDASAGGAGSDASSGDARTATRQFSVQRNLMVYVCTGRNGFDGGDQEASNVIVVGQDAAGSSGNAGATSGSDATTGDAQASLADAQRQFNRQIVVE